MCVFWELSVYIDLYHACVCIYACIKPPAMGAHDDIHKSTPDASPLWQMLAPPQSLHMSLRRPCSHFLQTHLAGPVRCLARPRQARCRCAALRPSAAPAAPAAPSTAPARRSRGWGRRQCARPSLVPFTGALLRATAAPGERVAAHEAVVGAAVRRGGTGGRGLEARRDPLGLDAGRAE